MSQTSLDELFTPSPRVSVAKTRFLAGIFATWYETKIGRKPRKGELARIDALAGEVSMQVGSLLDRLEREV
jgi:hypothetical protein